MTTVLISVFPSPFFFSICKCLNVGKYEQRVLEGLEAMKLPFSRVSKVKQGNLSLVNPIFFFKYPILRELQQKHSEVKSRCCSATEFCS